MKMQSNISATEKFIILACLVFLSFCSGFAQNDTVYMVKPDSVFIPQKQDIMYRLFVENKEAEIKHLWKTNLVGFRFLLPNVGFEQRIGKSFTVEGIAICGINRYTVNFPEGDLFYSSNDYTINNPTPSGLYFEFEQSFKYYFNLKRREKQGLKTNGFSANYIASVISFNRQKYNGTGYFMDTLKYESINFENTEKNLNVGLKYGAQRRIYDIINIEFYAGCYYNFRWDNITRFWPTMSKKYYSHKIIPFVGLRCGFAIGSFKNLKNRLKN
jgi:hypothetical protein